MGCRSASRLDGVGEGGWDRGKGRTGGGVADDELVVLDGDAWDAEDGDGVWGTLGLARVWYVLAMAIWDG